MAKSSNRGGGDGTNDRGGVRSTFSPAFNHPGTGSQNGMSAPFNAPRSGGANGLPTRVYDTSMGSGGGNRRGSTRDSPGTIMTERKGQR